MPLRVELFGGLRLVLENGEIVQRFATQKAAGLLAYLALTLPRAHPREVLAELFWPEHDPALSRNSLSVALSALRPLLGSALMTTRLNVGLDPAQVTTDVAEFEAQLMRGAGEGMRALYVDELLPGFYDDWTVQARERLKAQWETRFLQTTSPPAAKREGASRLPRIETLFVGRDLELAEVLRLLPSRFRVLTLKGMGGVGKTRLAHEAAPCFATLFPGGVFWVALEEVQTGDALLRAVAAALGLTLQSTLPIKDQVGHALALLGRVLVILDNTEQIHEASRIVRSLLDQAANCYFLVTSRHSLNLRSEAVLELQPLPLPDAERLFQDRARAANVGESLPHESAAAVTELCRRLDGLPLALELAAARVGSITPEQMLARLNERFRLLQSRIVDLPERQRTLRTAIDWSYHLLDEEEKRVLAQLSVFVGPFTLVEAEAVCLCPDSFERVLTLQECSLLAVDRSAPRTESRFLLLESLRDYAAERLAESAPLQADAYVRHAQYFLERAEALLARLRTNDEALALRQLDGLAANLRGALELGPPELAPRLALALARPLQRRGFFTEAIEPLECGLAVQRLPELVWERAGLHFDLGEYASASTLAEEARALYASAGDVVGEARSENLLGQVHYKEARWSEARALLQQALSTTPEPLERAIAQNNLALVELGDPDGDTETAIALLTEALIVRRAHGDQRGVAAVVANLGNLAFAHEDWAAAQRHFTEALEVETALGHVFGIARALNNLGETAEQQGENEHALGLYISAHKLFSELRHDYAAYTEGLLLALKVKLAP